MNRNESYKDSGVKWIGEIPKHWNLTKLKYLSNKNVQYGLNIDANSYNDSGVRFLRITDINQEGSLKETGCVYLDSSDVPSEYYLNQGDVLFARSGSVGKSTLINDDSALMSFAGYLVRFSFDDYSTSRFVKWMAESGFYWRWIHLQSIQSTIPNVNGEKYSNLVFPIPSIEEQKLISNYLDKKIEKIDSLIEKIYKKIELLKEQRTSLINQCVTKGLALNIEMKDSGIKWIGEIPKHWKPTRLKYIGFLYGGLSGKSGDNFNQDDNQHNKPYIPFTNINDNTYISKYNLCEVVVYPGEIQNEVKQNDLFFLMSSEDYEGIGKSSVLRDDIGEAYLNSFCKGFRITDAKYNPFFINYLLSGYSYRELLRIEGKGFTRINLQMNKINDIEIYAPPINEQKKISKYLDKKTSKIDTIIEKEIKRVELLKEYRQSLISSVVTGKIRITEDMV